ISRLETWFGRQYCHWELKINSLVNGLQLGMGRTRLIRFCLEMCNTRFIKEHKPSNHIRARIKSHVYTTEGTVYHSTYHVKRYNKANTNVIYYNNDINV